MAATVLAVMLVGACGTEPVPEQEPPSVPALDESEYDGLTPEELRLQAEPMTLEEAERLGIVDTTIHIEYPINPDSILPLPVDTGGN